MSTPSEAEFDLEKLFLPAWAKEGADVNRYAKFEGERERGGDRRRDGGGRGDRRDGPPRRPDGPQNRGPAPGGRPSFGRPPAGGPGRGPRPPQRDAGGRGPVRREAPPAPIPLPAINVAFVPEEHGVDSLAKQIRQTGRAYPLFDIAQMILSKPERHTVTFSIRTKPDKTPVQPLFLCALDDSLWLSEDDAVRHVLDRHFATFYQPERTQIDPPKGVYTFVAQCAMSGVILGPPNYHDYQNQLRRLHGERFSRMPFEAFKAQVRIVKDEAVVKKWTEDQSWKTEYACLNVPEPLKLANREEVEKHFREVHLPTIIKATDSHRVSGAVARQMRDRGLLRLVRELWEDQRRFPIQIATSLSQQFASRGLQFFKVNRSVTHVSVARPHFLDLEATPVSDGVRKIVEFIDAHRKCTHKQLLHALAPAPAAVPVATPPAEQSAPVEGTAPAEAPVVAAPEPAAPSAEAAAVMMDLHWLIHQGHVIEFGNGVLETAKRPVPKPTKPAPAAKAAPAPEAMGAPGTSVEPGEDAITSTESVSVPVVAEDAAAPAPEAPAAEAPPAPPTENNPS